MIDHSNVLAVFEFNFAMGRAQKNNQTDLRSAIGDDAVLQKLIIDLVREELLESLLKEPRVISLVRSEIVASLKEIEVNNSDNVWRI